MNLRYRHIRVLLVVGLIAATTATMIIAYTYVKNFENLIIGQTQKHLKTIAATKANHLQSLLDDVHSAIMILSTAPSTRAMFAGPPRRKADKIAGVSREALIFQHMSPFVNSLDWLDTNGAVIARSPARDNPPESHNTPRPCLETVISTHRPHISDVYTTDKGDEVVSICVPILREDTLAGMICGEIGLSAIAKDIMLSDATKDLYVQLVAEDGRLLVHPDPDQMGRNFLAMSRSLGEDADWTGLEQIYSRMLSGERGVEVAYSTRARHGIKHRPIKELVAFTPIKFEDKVWALVVTMRYDAIAGPVGKHAHGIFYIAGLLIVIFIGGTIGLVQAQKKQSLLKCEAKSAGELLQTNQQLQREIEEREQAEAELRESRQRLAIHLQETPLGAIEFGVDGIITEWNPSAENIFGYSCAEAIGRHGPGLIVPEDEQDMFALTWDELRERRGGFHNTGINVTKDGRRVICEWYNTPLVNSDGNVIGVASLVQDITERQRMEDIQAVLFRIATATSISTNLEGLLATIHDILGSLIDTTNFYVALYDAKNDTYTFPYLVDKFDEIDSLPRHLDGSITDYVRRTGMPLLARENDFHGLEQAGEIGLVGEPTAVWLGVPLNTTEGCIGVVVVQSYNNPDLYTNADLDLMTFVSGHIALAIARKVAEEARNESEKRFEELYNSVIEGVGLVNPQGIITFCNPSYAKIFEEKSAEAMIGKPLLDYLTDAQKELVREQSVRLRKGECSQYEVEIITAKGNRRTVLVSVSPRYDAENQYTGAFGAVIDITDTKRLREFTARAQRLETAGRIAGQVAHDFNNLLGPLVAYPELIKAQLPSDHKVIRYLNNMEKAAAQISEINQQLLTLGRRGHYNLEPLNLNEIVKQVVEQMGLAPETLSVELELADPLMNISGGRSQIIRALANLVANARDAMGDTGVLTLRTENYYAEETKGITTDISRGEYVKLTVRDTGTGVPPEVLPRIFDPFFTTKSTDKERGSGLGLSVVHAVVEDHHGRIDCDTEPGRGTAFYLYFPITRDAAVIGHDDRIVGGGEYLLVVDDDQMQLEVTRNLLEALGYRVATAECGEVALKLIAKESPDLLIVDMIMPGSMDGTETLKAARELDPNLKAIVASGYAETRRVQEAIDLGAGEFLKKPLTLKSLALAVRRNLDIKARVPTV